MTVELSGILEHVDRISALDLDDVPPTSHVVALENVLRADEPEPSLPREAALANAPDPRQTAPSACPRRRPRATASDGDVRAQRGRCDCPHRGRRPVGRRVLRRLRRGRGRRRAQRVSVDGRGRCRPPRPTVRCAVCRWPSRTCSVRRACRRPPARGSSRATCRPTRRPLSPGFGNRVAACSARRTWTSSRWARRTRTPATARCETRGTAGASRAARRAARPPPLPAASPRGRSAPTPAARSASRRRCAGSSASSPPTARSRATGWSPSPPRSTSAAR